MRDANVHTLHAPNSELHTLGPRRVEITKENAVVRVLFAPGGEISEEFGRRYNMLWLPGSAIIGRETRVDRGDAHEAAQVYAAGLITAPLSAPPLVPSLNDLRDAITERIQHDWTHAILITPSLAHSRTFDNAVQAAQHVSVVVNRLRKSSVVPLPFQLAVIESGTFSAGTGVLAFDAIARSKVGLFGDRLMHHVEGMRRLIHTYVVVKDFAYLDADRLHMVAPGWNLFAKMLHLFGLDPIFHVNSGAVSVARRARGYQARAKIMLEQCAAGVHAGLKTPAVCVSFAGDPAHLKQFPGFEVLTKACAEKRAWLLVTPMSLTEAARLGPGAIVVAFASSGFRPA